MGFDVRAKSAAIVVAAVLVFGVALPLVNTGMISGATGNKSAVGKKSPVKKPVKQPVKPVTTPVTKPVTNGGIAPLTVSLPAARSGQSYLWTLKAEGGVKPYRCTPLSLHIGTLALNKLCQITGKAPVVHSESITGPFIFKLHDSSKPPKTIEFSPMNFTTVAGAVKKKPVPTTTTTIKNTTTTTIKPSPKANPYDGTWTGTLSLTSTDEQGSNNYNFPVRVNVYKSQVGIWGTTASSTNGTVLSVDYPALVSDIGLPISAAGAASGMVISLYPPDGTTNSDVCNFSMQFETNGTASTVAPFNCVSVDYSTGYYGSLGSYTGSIKLTNTSPPG